MHAQSLDPNLLQHRVQRTSHVRPSGGMPITAAQFLKPDIEPCAQRHMHRVNALPLAICPRTSSRRFEPPPAFAVYGSACHPAKIRLEPMFGRSFYSGYQWQKQEYFKEIIAFTYL